MIGATSRHSTLRDTERLEHVVWIWLFYGFGLICAATRAPLPGNIMQITELCQFGTYGYETASNVRPPTLR